jgi:hypothetical protein
MEHLRHQPQPVPPDVSEPRQTWSEHSGVPPADVATYNQLLFEELEVKTEEVEIGRLLVTAPPLVKKSKDGTDEWICKVTYQRDLWHQEEYYSFVLHARHNFEEVKSLKIRKGETLQVRGTPWQQELPLHGGGMRVINHINVATVEVTSRAEPGGRR